MNKRNSYILATFIWPFYGLVSSIKNWKQPWAMNVFWLACIYLGAVHIYTPEGLTVESGADGGRYALKLIELYQFTGSPIELLKQEGTVDFYQPLLTYIVSRFTDNGHVLFMLFAFVFGFFYSRNIWFVLNRMPQHPDVKQYLYVAILFLICPIWEINGVRMWTALHILLYGLLPYLCDGDKKRIKWCFVTPLVHFSYLYVIALIVVFVYCFRGSFANSSLFRKAAFVFFISSLTINALDIQSVSEKIRIISPDVYEERIDIYTRDTTIETQHDGPKANWYVGLSSNIVIWVCTGIVVFTFFFYKRIMILYCDIFNRFYLFLLVFGGVANIMGLVPSAGRFLFIFRFLVITYAMLVILHLPQENRLRKITKGSSVLLILPIVFFLRRCQDFYGIMAIFGNFLTALFVESNIPLIDFVKLFIS